MRLSARNQLKGTVVDIHEGVTNAKVTVDIGNGNKITSMISVEAVKELNIQVGSQVVAVIKASSVMLGIDG